MSASVVSNVSAQKASNADDSTTAAKLKETWENRRQAFRDNLFARDSGPHKHSFISWALKTGQPDKGIVQDWLRRVNEREKDVDMYIISLVRVLYLLRAESKRDNSSLDAQKAICDSLNTFPYWPCRDFQTLENDNLCFWSENHILMTLGSAHLVRQFNATNKTRASMQLPNPTNTLAAGSGANAGTDRGSIVPAPYNVDPATVEMEQMLLLSYLKAHADSEMMFEVLSHVYIPYTISSLLNLIDFSENEAIREAARKWLSVALRHVLLGTTDAGVATLTASARAFKRTREDYTGHNINSLIYFLTGLNIDTLDGGIPGSSQVTDFLLTTKWCPTPEDISSHMFEGALTLRASPAIESIRQMFSGVSEAERIPFYWSAGLVLHPEFTKDTKAYQHRKMLNKNDFIKGIAWVPGMLASGLVRAYGPLSRGQSYCNITLNIYKRHGGLCLSSFEKFNEGNCAFQQLPWCANIGGAGVWTQTGEGSGSALNNAFTNTYNPCIRQRGPLCIIGHKAPPSMAYGPVTGFLFSYTAKLYWPAHLFDESYVLTRRPNPAEAWFQFNEATQNSAVACWRIARRGSCFIGVYCTGRTFTLTNPDDVLAGKVKEHITINCNDRKHAWVVLVGTANEYANREGKAPKTKSNSPQKTAVSDGATSNPMTNNLRDHIPSPTAETSPALKSISSTQPTTSIAQKLKPLDAFKQRCLSLRINLGEAKDGRFDVTVEDSIDGNMSLRG